MQITRYEFEYPLYKPIHHATSFLAVLSVFAAVLILCSGSPVESAYTIAFGGHQAAHSGLPPHKSHFSIFSYSGE
jgi:hypothetical protein